MVVDINKGVSLSKRQKETVKASIGTNCLCYLSSRQTGKDFLARELIKSFMFRYDKRKNPILIFLTPFAQQAVDIGFKKLWEEDLKDLQDILLFKQGNVSSGRVIMTLNRPWLNDSATIIFAGTHNARGLRGRTADVIIVNEAAFMDGEVYSEIIRPFRNYTDGKIFITSTVNGYNNWFYDIYEMISAELRPELCRYLMGSIKK